MTRWDSQERRLGRIERELRELRAFARRWEPVLRGVESEHRRRLDVVLSVITHTIVLLALLVAAVTLTIHGDDANTAWAAFGSYAVGAGVDRATNRRAP